MQLLWDWYLAFGHPQSHPYDSRWLLWFAHLCTRHPSNSWALSPRLEVCSKHMNIRLHSDVKGCQSKGLAANNDLSWDFRAPAGTQMCSGTFLQGGWWSAPRGTQPTAVTVATVRLPDLHIRAPSLLVLHTDLQKKKKKKKMCVWSTRTCAWASWI